MKKKDPPMDAETLKRLVSEEPKKAASTILALYEQHACMWREVAKKLSIHYVTLWRWVKQLGIEEEVTKVQKRNRNILTERLRNYGREGGKLGGWPRGRPRKQKTEMQS